MGRHASGIGESPTRPIPSPGGANLWYLKEARASLPDGAPKTTINGIGHRRSIGPKRHEPGWSARL